jgi:hypothetical protein
MELVKIQHIESRIFTIRNIQILVDRDLAELYQVETKVLNQAVKRNIDRFPDDFRFQLSETEKNELVTNCDRFQNLKHSSSNPYAFTEQGVAMLSAVLRSNVAVQISIQIMQAFVNMRKLILNNAALFNRLDKIETKQFEADQKFEQIFKALEAGQPKSDKGIFFDGQVFDAYVFVADLIKNAKKDILLIDNYVDETVLMLLSKRAKGVNATVYTKNIRKELTLDLKKHNKQYPNIQLCKHTHSHDRFLIIDQQELYHIGASLKDLGKKWFAFSKMSHLTNLVLSQIEKT